jgi:hypothetical protein
MLNIDGVLWRATAALIVATTSKHYGKFISKGLDLIPAKFTRETWAPNPARSKRIIVMTCSSVQQNTRKRYIEVIARLKKVKRSFISGRNQTLCLAHLYFLMKQSILYDRFFVGGEIPVVDTCIRLYIIFGPFFVILARL